MYGKETDTDSRFFTHYLEGVYIMLRSRWEVLDFLRNFESYANWDGEKFYLSLETEKPKGILTLMKSKEGAYYYHRKNELYWDLKEMDVDRGILSDIIWTFRTQITKSLTERAG